MVYLPTWMAIFILYTQEVQKTKLCLLAGTGILYMDHPENHFLFGLRLWIGYAYIDGARCFIMFIAFPKPTFRSWEKIRDSKVIWHILMMPSIFPRVLCNSAQLDAYRPWLRLWRRQKTSGTSRRRTRLARKKQPPWFVWRKRLTSLSLKSSRTQSVKEAWGRSSRMKPSAKRSSTLLGRPGLGNMSSGTMCWQTGMTMSLILRWYLKAAF